MPKERSELDDEDGAPNLGVEAGMKMLDVGRIGISRLERKAEPTPDVTCRAVLNRGGPEWQDADDPLESLDGIAGQRRRGQRILIDTLDVLRDREAGKHRGNP